MLDVSQKSRPLAVDTLDATLPLVGAWLVLVARIVSVGLMLLS